MYSQGRQEGGGAFALGPHLNRARPTWEQEPKIE
jgi:hypothetical protein